MCLIAVAWRASSSRPLVVAANRDEAHARPSAAAAWWQDAPDVLAGRDLSAGGTWLGVDRRGRFAAVTNLRPNGARVTAPRSRGALVAGFLRGRESAERYAARIGAESDAYGPFNLLVADHDSLWFVGTRTPAHPLAPGVHALSNVEPDVDWPKVTAARERLREVVDRRHVDRGDIDRALFALLAERRAPADGYDVRQVSPFQLDPVWGTRSSTVVVMDAGGKVRFVERSFDPGGAPTGEVRFEFAASRPPAGLRGIDP